MNTLLVRLVVRHHDAVAHALILPKVKSSDFDTFDYIFAMDRDNLRDLQRLQERVGGKGKVMLFGEFSGRKAEEIDDPYCKFCIRQEALDLADSKSLDGGRNGFTIAYEQAMRFSKNFLKQTFPDVEA